MQMTGRQGIKKDPILQLCPRLDSQTAERTQQVTSGRLTIFHLQRPAQKMRAYTKQ